MVLHRPIECTGITGEVGTNHYFSGFQTYYEFILFAARLSNACPSERSLETQSQCVLEHPLAGVSPFLSSYLSKRRSKTCARQPPAHPHWPFRARREGPSRAPPETRTES